MQKHESAIYRPTWKEQNYMPYRYLVSMMAFFGMSFVYMLRASLNLAIVTMVQPSSSPSNSSQRNDNNECGYQAGNSTVKNDYAGEFEWNELTQSIILASFYWGYFWTQLPGGRLADVFGARRVLGISVLSSAILSFLIPFAAHQSYKALIVVRILLGVSQGASFPACLALVASWAPPNERSLLTSIVLGGTQLGTVCGYLLTAVIIEGYGWENAFYIESAMAIVWVIMWLLIVTDGPARCRWITTVEKDYIIRSIGDSKKAKAPPMPWRKALSSLPVWAIVVAWMGNNWGLSTMNIEMPLYMKEILKLDIKSNALLSSLPYVGMLVFSLGISNMADILRRKGVLSTVTVRKLANTIGHGGPALCFVSLSLVECDRSATIVLLFSALTLQGAIYTGFLANTIDITPNFAGTVVGFANAIASIPAWLAPMAAGALTNENQTLAQWRIVFNIAAAIFTIDSLFYLFCASGVEQEWNKFENHETDVHSDDRKTSTDGDNHNINAETNDKDDSTNSEAVQMIEHSVLQDGDCRSARLRD